MITRTDAATSAAPSRLALNSAHVAFTTIVFFTVFGANGLRNLVGWWGWAVIVVVLFAISMVWIVRSGLGRQLYRLPLPLLAFVAFALVSTTWSHWPLETLEGSGILIITVLSAVPLATLITWDELLVGLSGATRLIVGLSVLFELVVSVIIRHPVLPVYVDWTTWDKASLQLLWSRNLLFDTGKIQGIVGNSTILAGVAGVALVAVIVQLAARRMGRAWGLFWIVLIVATLVGTRSATIYVALFVTALVLAAVLIRRRLTAFISRAVFYGGIIVVIVGGAVLVSALWTQILGLLGKTDTLTGRTEIWANTIELAVQRPIFGWGWLGYWPPWVEPLNTLNVLYGVPQLHAHDAWIDLWMQVGIVGGVIFALVVIVALARSYRTSVTPVWDASTGREGFQAATLLPILVLAVLIVQSITESRLLVEEGLLTLAVFAIKLKLQPFNRISTGATTRS
jgi:hypothetical protein